MGIILPPTPTAVRHGEAECCQVEVRRDHAEAVDLPPAQRRTDPRGSQQKDQAEHRVRRGDIGRRSPPLGHAPAPWQQVPCDTADGQKERPPPGCLEPGAPEPESRHQQSDAHLQKPGAHDSDGDAPRASPQRHRIELVESPEDRRDDDAESVEVGDGKHSRRQKPTRREIRRDRNEACTSEQEPGERPGEMGTRQAERWSTAHGINVALENASASTSMTRRWSYPRTSSQRSPRMSPRLWIPYIDI